MGRLLENWYQLTTPEPLPDDETPARYETWRRTRLASSILLVLVLLWLLGAPLGFASPLGAGMMVVFVEGALVFVLGLAFTRRGWVHATAILLILSFYAGFVLLQIFAGGLAVERAVTFNLLLLPLLFAAQLLGPRGLFTVTLLDLGLMALAVGSWPGATRDTLASAGTFLSVIAPPVALQLAVALLGYVWMRSVRDAVERATRAEELAAANASLRRMSDAALEVARLKSEVPINMSHALNRPLDTMLGLTDHLLQTPLDDLQHDIVDGLRSSTGDMLAMLDDVRDLSVLERGAAEPDIMEVAPRAVVESVADMLLPLAVRKRLSLMTFVAPEVPEQVTGDQARLRQVLLRLTHNALKFTERGEVMVRVGPLARSGGIRGAASEGMLRFEVSDTGSGISDPVRKRLYQPFTHSDASEGSEGSEGAGLSLAMCKRLAELMGGEIGFESTAGVGTTFWFTARLPRAESMPATLGAHVSLLERHVLIVDAHRMQQKVLQSYLASAGMRCQCVSDGTAALAALRRYAQANNPFEVVLLDQTLLGTGPAAFAQAMREAGAFETARLVLLTTPDELETGERALPVGFAAQIDKPVKLATLLDTLVAVLEEPAPAGTRDDLDAEAATNPKIAVVAPPVAEPFEHVEPIAGAANGSMSGSSGIVGEQSDPAAAAFELPTPAAGSHPLPADPARAATEPETQAELASDEPASTPAPEVAAGQLDATSKLNLEATSKLNLEPTGKLNLDETSKLKLDATSKLNLDPTSKLNLDSTTRLRRGATTRRDRDAASPVDLDATERLTTDFAPPSSMPEPAAHDETPHLSASEVPSLPAQDGALQPLEESEPPSPARPPNAPSAPRVLLVDDNSVNQKLGVLHLQRLGYAADVAGDGQEALEKLATGTYALVLMDIAMPVMDGYEATRAIREAERGTGRHIPIIAVTANLLLGDRERCLDAGMDDYLAKPVRMAMLRSVMEYWVPLTRAGGDATTSADHSPARTEGGYAMPFLPTQLDLAQLDAIQALQTPGAPDVLAAIIAEFRNEAPRLVETMHLALKGDVSALFAAAHSLKSSSAYVGATELSAACARLETASARSLSPDAGILVQQVERELERALVALAALGAEPAPRWY